MDKRFLLALVLTAVVVIVTPLLFRTQPSPITPGATPPTADLRDSANRVVPVPSVVENPRDSAAPAVSGVTRDSTASIPVTSVVAETTVVSTPVAAYQM